MGDRVILIALFRSGGLNQKDFSLGLLAPIEPFRTVNRFSTATVFGILAFEVLKIFEEALFRTGQPMNHGVLFELLERIALVMLVGYELA